MAILQSWSPQRALDSAWEVIANNWYLGFIAFGGPPVHFQIVRKLHFGVIDDSVFWFCGDSKFFEC